MQSRHLITNVMTIAERLKHAREKRDLTQQQLAKIAGVTQSTIANIENGIRQKPRAIISIAKALAVDPGWLESGKGQAYPSNVTEAERSSSTSSTSIQAALDVLERELTKLDMPGRERMAPLFESFARSPGAVIKKDIAALLEAPDNIKSQASISQTFLQKIG